MNKLILMGALALALTGCGGMPMEGGYANYQSAYPGFGMGFGPMGFPGMGFGGMDDDGFGGMDDGGFGGFGDGGFGGMGDDD
ncbi:hypothetical protein GALL_06630 [mine drainage metagenome]|uniref:Lipoprotein n=1 Tax=mine drainage metagenome TaxID=410659 RepID=A0A1J5THZ9_9ZZZZ